MNYCYGLKPFEVGRVIKLVKEPDNEYDAEAIRAELPIIDKIGYVANRPNMVAYSQKLREQIEFEDDAFLSISMMEAPEPLSAGKRSLADVVGHLDESFSQMLLWLIDEKGMRRMAWILKCK